MASGSSDKTTIPILEQYELLWESDAHAQTGPDVFEFLQVHAGQPPAALLNVVLADQYRRWHLGSEILAERYFEACDFLTDEMRFELVAEELGYQEERSGFDPVAFLVRFKDVLSKDHLEELERELSVERTASPVSPAPEAREHVLQLEPGDALGRYTLKRVLGSGSFGVVYLAQDTELLRDVAIKVPNAERISRSGGIEAFLNEARVVAALDHPAIVPIYDVATTEDGRCYLVSKFIDGGDLRAAIDRGFGAVAAADLVATIARAAHHAHRCQVIHRDIKPANVLLDDAGNPYLVDFGLAMRDAEFGTGSEFVGTPAWMSPEQANGEGHRVDARSDVYSLGVVLFELLTGKRPYRAGSTDELLEQIRSGDVRPPRQFDDTIPRALDSICMKSLARRASERYSTALDFAEELEAFVVENSSQKSSLASIGKADSRRPEPEQPGSTGSSKSNSWSDSHGATVVPRGLRSFDAGDADFFLRLLPGPRDRFGLPDSLRFWTSRIRQPHESFPVGLLYGPSGCGKSSFMKAGLIPQLKDDVDCVYIEAAQVGTELRLLRALHTQRPELGGLTLSDALSDLRRGRTRKTLIVIDQFEQWLHKWDEDASSELLTALRQCDGRFVQALVMVRDDFWMAATRCFRELEVPLVEGDNSGAIDLFDKRHARKVLRAFGVAFNALPQSGTEDDSQKQFIRSAIDGIAENDRISPVRLALFAEMLKGRDWNPVTLRQLGGTAGVGIAFLDDCFGQAAPAPRRAVARAAERLLGSLLPTPGADIRGAARTRAELQSASEISDETQFDSLLLMLDQQLRLITPTESRDSDSTEGPVAARYQLTHDYLVPSIRQWIAQRRSMTFRGRVRSTMIERAEQWNQLPETRLLPAWWEDIGFRLFTRSKDWNEAHRRMMSRSGRRVLLLLTGTIVALAIAFFAARDVNGRFRANAVHKRLLNANTNELPAILDEAAAYRSWLLPSLEGLAGLDSANAESGQPSRRRELHRQLALLRLKRHASNELYDSLLEAQPAAYATINRILPQHTSELDTDVLWSHLTNPTGSSSQRRRASAILARLAPMNDKWSGVAEDVAKLLAKSDPAEAGYWITELTPVREHLAEYLKPNLGARGLELTTRRTTARALAGFYSRDVEKLVELTIQSRSVEFAEFAPVLLDFGSRLSQALDRAESKAPAGTETSEAAARREANIAALRIHIQSEPNFKVFEEATDPTSRSYLIHHYPISGGGPSPLIALLNERQSSAVKYSSLLTLGEISRERFSTAEFEKLILTSQKWFRTDPDPGVHSACAWLLRTFGETDFIRQANRELASQSAPEGQGWYVSSSGLTMIHVEGPFDLRIGSSKEDLERFFNEAQLVRHCGRSFALSSTEITRRLYAEFVKENRLKMPNVRLPFESDDAAVTEVFWPRAAQFCNWLSKRDGIPEDQWCYAPNKEGKYVGGVMQKENNLQLTGYRLPTHYEWEYATKAGTVTSRFYGRGTDLLKHYSWHSSNSQMMVREPGQLKPSHWGFFDTLGNAYEWCTARASMQIELGPTHPPYAVPGNRLMRVRGGSFVEQARYHRAPRRSYFSAMTDGEQIGIRVARTTKVHDTETPIVDRLDTRYFDDKN